MDVEIAQNLWQGRGSGDSYEQTWFVTRQLAFLCGKLLLELKTGVM